MIEFIIGLVIGIMLGFFLAIVRVAFALAMAGRTPKEWREFTTIDKEDE